MSKLKTNTIQHTGGSADNITLDNSQNVTIEGNLTIPDKIIHDGDTNTAIRFPAADTISAETGGTERLRVDSSGRLIQRYSTDPYDNRAATFQSASGVDSTYIAVVNTETNGTSGILFGDHAGQNAGNYTGYINYQHNNNEMRFMTNGGNERFKIGSGGDVSVTDGNLVVASGHGIDFSATGDGSGSMGNELLDDYEEGTFTATLGGADNHSTYNITSNNAYYTRIGRVVHVSIHFENKNLDDNAAGEIKISGVPYDPASGGGWTTNFTSYNVVFDTSERQQLYISGPNIYGLESANNSSWSDWQVSDFHNSTMYLRCNMTYHTS